MSKKPMNAIKEEIRARVELRKWLYAVEELSAGICDRLFTITCRDPDGGVHAQPFDRCQGVFTFLLSKLHEIAPGAERSLEATRRFDGLRRHDETTEECYWRLKDVVEDKASASVWRPLREAPFNEVLIGMRTDIQIHQLPLDIVVRHDPIPEGEEEFMVWDTPRKLLENSSVDDWVFVKQPPAGPLVPVEEYVPEDQLGRD